MNVFEINPLQDPRWQRFLDGSPASSVFHAPPWIRALQRTYGYEPVVFTTSPANAELSNGVLACRVKSWITGVRLVSVPFSDHCQPLVEDSAQFCAIAKYLQDRARAECWKYIEFRPLNADLCEGSEVTRYNTYRFHAIDLRPELDRIYKRFHESCVRRKVRKAEREQLQYEAGRSDALLQKFWVLLLLTRRRHQVPPQPLVWFRNLIECLGTQLTIHMVSKGSDPIASIVTVAYKKSLVYKYGVSDVRFNNLGGTPLLFWKAIMLGKAAGAETLDLGRSGLEDPGLSTFKEHLGGIASELTYYRCSRSQSRNQIAPSAATLLARRAFARLPERLFTGAGTLLYKHLA